MNFLLKNRQEIENATKWLQDNGYVESGISAKNWEVRQIIPYMEDGNMIDLGSDGSVVLINALKKNIQGVKVGIDLVYPENIKSEIDGIDLIKGDLTNVPFPDGFFNFISCLSVIEHSVNIENLAKECGRLLSKGGQLFISCDYWNIKQDTSKTKLYSLDWKILDRNDVLDLVRALKSHGLHITGDIDWVVQDAVINDQYCSPVQGISYTFFIGSFIKQ